MTNFFCTNHPKSYENNSNLFELRISKIHGYGVFAKSNIKENFILETTKPYTVNKSLFYLIIFYSIIYRIFKKVPPSNITRYLFIQRLGEKIIKIHLIPSLFSYCNNSRKFEPNCKIYYDDEIDVYYLKSLRQINVNEEILIRYE